MSNHMHKISPDKRPKGPLADEHQRMSRSWTVCEGRKVYCAELVCYREDLGLSERGVNHCEVVAT